jgi:hypothetical protein
MLLVSLPASADSGVRAWLDRDTMHLGETVTLNVEASDVGTTQPDFSSLAQDFTVLGTQSSQQVAITNGTRTAKMLWAVGLEPKHEGQITIAPLNVGNASTAPIHLNVASVPATVQQAGSDVFLEATAEPLTPYVQQQVRYTLKLYYAFDLTDGNLGEPKADGLAVQRLGQDKSYVATVGTRRYHVLERHYALTPERSGAIEIPALAFRGTVLDAADPAAFFGRGRSIGARAEAVHLEVKAKPAAWTDAAWLPAASLLLKDEGELPNEVHVGEPVTRTIRLQAQGLGYEQLPEIALDTPAGAEIYPDKTDTRTRDDGEWLYGERVRKFAFVPNRAGTLTLPGLRVRWWDTTHDRLETTELPAHSVNVLPAAGTSSAPAPPGQVDSATPSPHSAALPNAAAPTTLPFASDTDTGLWKMLATIAFVLWLATLLAWWYTRQLAPVAAKPSSFAAPAASTSAQRAAFLRACALGELAGAERALVAWARGERADVRNLGELAARIDDDAQRDALSDLERARYAGLPVDGLAVRLQRAFQPGFAWRDSGAAQRAAATLPALYPERE